MAASPVRTARTAAARTLFPTRQPPAAKDAASSRRAARPAARASAQASTSAIVQPAASLTDLAIDAGAVTVQVNPNATGIEERVSFALRGPAGSVLAALLERAWP